MSEQDKAGPGPVQAPAPEAAASDARAHGGAPGRASLVGQGDGEPLPEGPRQKYEATLGASLGNVRVHEGAQAATLNRQVGAKAFAYGNSIFMGAGMSAKDPAHEKVLAEEVAHTVQQRGSSPADKPATTTPGDAAESEATTAADAMVAGRPASVSPQPSAIARHGGKDQKEPVEKTEADYIDPDWLSATPFAISKGGGLTTTDVGGSVVVKSPEITAHATASLNLPEDKKLGAKNVKVGPIQTLMSSTRTGVYKKDNATKEQSSKMGKIRDVAPVTNDANNPIQNTFEKNSGGPFYSGNPDLAAHESNKKGGADPKGEAPTSDLSTLDDYNKQAQVVLIDQPKHALPKVLPDGSKLVGMKGSEEFNTSVGFKTSTGNVFAKEPFGWKLSWDKDINTDKPQAEQQAKPGDKQKDAIETFAAKEAVVEDTEVYAVSLGNINSVDDATAKGITWLIKNLAKAREASGEKADLMEKALARWKIVIGVTPEKNASGVEDATGTITMSINASMTKRGATKTLTTTPKVAAKYTIALGDIVDVKTIAFGQTIGVAANEIKTGLWDTPVLGGTCDVALPEGGSTTTSSIVESNFSYKVTASWG